MKVVVYDDAMLEPITVLNLRGFSENDIEKLGRVLRVAVPKPLTFSTAMEADPVMEKVEVVELFFEQFYRNSPRWGEQRKWMCLTSSIDLVLLLKPDWLLGQQQAIDYLHSHNERLSEMLLNAMAR